MIQISIIYTRKWPIKFGSAQKLLLKIIAQNSFLQFGTLSESRMNNS